MDYELLKQQNAELQKRLEESESVHQKQLDLKDRKIEIQNQKMDLLAQKLRMLQFEIKNLLAERYARKRERFVGIPQPLLPFEEANENTPIPDSPHAAEAPDEETTEGITYTRSKPRRMEKLPENLRRETTEIDPPAEELICQDCRVEKTRIGSEKTEKLNYIPASFMIEETIRYKYACRKCEQSVSIAALPPRAIDRGLPGEGLLAHVILSKYGDHLPLNRQMEIYKRQGIDISVSTRCCFMRRARRVDRRRCGIIKTTDRTDAGANLIIL